MTMASEPVARSMSDSVTAPTPRCSTRISTSSPTSSWSSEDSRASTEPDASPLMMRLSSCTRPALRASSRFSLENLDEALKAGLVQELNLIIKGDASGSVEALESSLLQLDVGEEVDIRVLHRGVGAVTE